MKRMLAVVTALGLVAIAAAPPTATAVSTKAPKKYANCTELNKDYKHGVARKGARDRTTSGRPVTTFTVNNAVYALNKTRDRDRDGVACEKR